MDQRPTETTIRSVLARLHLETRRCTSNADWLYPTHTTAARLPWSYNVNDHDICAFHDPRLDGRRTLASGSCYDVNGLQVHI